MANQNTAIATISSAELAQGTTFTPRQVDLIREQIMPGASDDDLMLFVQVASSRGLDPFRKHIYAVSRRAKVGNDWVDKWSYQVSIDGLRLIAQRSGRYEGQTPAQWCGPDGQWTEVWLADEPPAAAKVGVYIRGTREPLYAIALYKTFVQKTKEGNPTKFWADMPEHMLAKVAESQALRKAFPEEAGGLYTTEEMGQASSDTGGVIDVEATPPPQQRGPTTRTTATVSPLPSEDPARKKAAADLWRLARDTFGWDEETLDLVAYDRTEQHLVDLDGDALKALYMELVGMGPQEREDMIRVLLVPVEGERKAAS